MDEIGVEVFLIHPWELNDHDWLEIAQLAQKYAADGETNFVKACVLGYVEWLGVDHIHDRKH